MPDVRRGAKTPTQGASPIVRDEETNMLALVKGMERYVFLYTDDKAAEDLFIRKSDAGI